MISQFFTGLANTYFDKEDIHSVQTVIHKTNNQIDHFRIIFNQDVRPDFRVIGNILEDVSAYTVDSEYGDMTNFTVRFTPSNTEPDGEWRDALLFIIGIDS